MRAEVSARFHDGFSDAFAERSEGCPSISVGGAPQQRTFPPALAYASRSSVVLPLRFSVKGGRMMIWYARWPTLRAGPLTEPCRAIMSSQPRSNSTWLLAIVVSRF